MYVNTQQIQIGVTNFIENEIAKKAVGANKFMVYFAMPIINKKIIQCDLNFKILMQNLTTVVPHQAILQLI